MTRKLPVKTKSRKTPPRGEFIFEWVPRKIKSDTEGEFVRHYLVSASGEIVGTVDEPIDGRLAYFVDLFGSHLASCWINLEMAKTKLELDYVSKQREDLGNKSK